MEIQELKQYIYDNKKVEDILNELGCHNIKYHNNKYYSCAFPDGDNPNGLIVYDNEYLNITSYTRTIKNPFNVTPSIIDVVCFLKDLYISNAIKWICDLLGLDYYSSMDEELPSSLQWTKLIYDMEEKQDNDEDERLKPLNEKILSYYKPYCNYLFKNDGISFKVQKQFNVGYDFESNRLTIPIYDELGICVGVKGRSLNIGKTLLEDKYIFIESCSKTRILFGLDKALNPIKTEDRVIVVESEKGVMKAFSDGIYNVVAIGGHCLSKTQVRKLTALGVSEIVLCYDEDVFRDENGKVSKKEYKEEVNKFIEQQRVSVMVDINGDILDKKESPIDNIEKFKKMYENRILLR